ncbi:TPA: ABC transporter ATP-binding protein [Patescibacteria group bacterium]|nr:MAG: ABC transporter-related protein [Parcubacteria group bacterium GW2011_GWF2_40_10]KKR47632.1 MAG: ABC transporter-related protein [Parcubacteria group bacterium GW2011_GWA2_40_143]KKR59997.1 MAG: ABC transporter-related protein [Parcubacteria group bacterium GW2011_GWC2_40_31]KKR75531.1 MAG: ABC transporter-related protein [Parcubacteria group bacterium GW2011_GWB2_40_8]KKR82718.1 MAG: ABC transporter-related protein [Parcubacteria group bacterium GW2011_GWD2_40_9]HBB56846.1 ABC transpo
MRKVKFTTILGYFWPHVKKYKKSFYLTFLIYGAAAVISSLIIPLIYREIISIISNATDKELILNQMTGLLIKLVVAIIAYNIIFKVGFFLLIFNQSNILRELANYTFSKLNNHSYRFFSNNFSGSLVAKGRRFTRAFEVIHDIIIFDIAMGLIKLVGIFIILTWIEPILGGLFFIWTIIYIALTVYLARKKVKYDLAEAEADSVVTGKLADAIANILNIKIFSAKEREYKNFSYSTCEEEIKRRKAGYFGGWVDTVKGFLLATLEIVGMYVVIKLWFDGIVSTGTVVLVQIYISIIFGAVWNVGKAVTRLSKSFSDAAEMVEIFETAPDISDPTEPEKCKIKEGHIKFDNVSFEYYDGAPVFSNFSLEIKPGEKVGLVGHSGAGKTTITKLLLRFADIQSGNIFIDGQNIAKITQDDLRNNIAYVPQESILFHRSLRENIGYGNPEASVEEIIEAAKKAHAHEFISCLPKGYDTLVGERGVKLSGGERQRVAIARAMLKKAPILLLDEATSSLDTISEKYIREAFEELMKGRTTIVIAHRLSTIQKMDRIIVLEDGDIAEQGSHKELLAGGRVYKNLWSHQVEGFME